MLRIARDSSPRFARAHASAKADGAALDRALGRADAVLAEAKANAEATKLRGDAEALKSVIDSLGLKLADDRKASEDLKSDEVGIVEAGG